MTIKGNRKQILLERRVAECITNSHLTLDLLQKMTGIHRAKLGRMRLCKATVSCDEAEQVFAAVRKPSRALITLALLGDERILSSETIAYLDNFMADLPDLLGRLNDLGPTLNPKWAHGSAQLLGTLMEQHADRRMQAETFGHSGRDAREF